MEKMKAKLVHEEEILESLGRGEIVFSKGGRRGFKPTYRPPVVVHQQYVFKVNITIYMKLKNLNCKLLYM
jgi:hypothetical protein